MEFRRVLAAGLLCLAVTGCATTKGPVYQESARRRSWYTLLRPARETPAAQLDYARTLRDTGSPRKAGRHYRALVASWPTAPEAAVAQREYADLRYARRDWEGAFEAYEDLQERFSGQFPYETVLERQFEIAGRRMEERKLRFLFGGFHAPEQAVPMFESIIKSAPSWPKAAEAQFRVGEAHELNEEYAEAALAYTEAQYRFAGSPWTEEAAFRRARCLYRLAGESPNDLQLAEDAWYAMTQFVRMFPASAHVAEGEQMAAALLDGRARKVLDKARYYDRHGRSPEAARLAYESYLTQFPRAEGAEFARRRLTELKAQKESSAHEDTP